MKRLSTSWPLVLWLTLVWVGLWGSVTVANVLGGLVVALVLVAVLPLPSVPDRAVVKPLAVLHFAGYFVVELATASVQVVRLALRPRLALNQGVVAVQVRGASDPLLTLLANAISLTPGTITLEVDRPTTTLFVHVLDVGTGPDGVEDVRRDILELERRAILAVGSPDARRALAEDSRRRSA